MSDYCLAIPHLNQMLNAIVFFVGGLPVKFAYSSITSKVLNYQLPTIVILLSYTIWFTVGVLFIIDLLALAAVIFTPYLLFALKKENCMGWIILFIAIVIIPTVISTILYIIYNPLLPFLFSQ